ncbi:MAG: hypothetical protein LBQ83_00460 [Candidatus Margulisbacteria bacterium]|jgi:hypothetical protein|nr:hypothetical protein [Candidatus Margulisiibacteriota bacterium]
MVAVNDLSKIQNQARLDNQEIRLAKDLRHFQKQTDKVESTKQQTLTQLLDKNVQDRGTNIVSNAVASFARSTLGKMFDENHKIKVKDKELNANNYLHEGEESAEDTVSITRKNIRALSKEPQIRRGDKEHAEKFQLQLDSETQELMKHYTQLYGQVVSSRSGAAAEELDKLERKLKDKGLDNTQLLELKLSIKNSLRSEVLGQIKSAFLKRTVSMEMVVELGTAERGLNDLLGFIQESPELGGVDFGGYRTDLQGAVDHASEEVFREVRLALKDMLDQKMTERLTSTEVDPKAVRKELKDLLELGKRVGFDTTEYMKVWYKEKNDQGLFIFHRPDLAVNIQANLQQQNSGSGQEAAEPAEPAEETEDYLINRLRALYIRSALKSDWRTSLDTSLKIIKTKNNLIKLGIFSNDINDKVREESRLIAGLKIMEMLREALMERATLYRLAGPAYKLNEARLTGLLRNAKKLGMELTDYEFTLVRDRANEAVFEAAKRELKLTKVALAVKETPLLRDKKRKLIQLLERLKKESGIQDDLGLPENDLSDRVKIASV